MDEISRGTKRKSTHSSKDKSKKRSKQTEQAAIDGGSHQSAIDRDGTTGDRADTMPKKTKKSKKDKRQTEATNTEALSFSPFTHLRASMYVTIPPILQGNAMQAVCANQLSPLIGLYYPDFKGTILAYTNIQFPGQSRAKENGGEQYILARSINEYAQPQTWISAEFLVFQPATGSVLEGYINVQEESFVNLVVYNWFSASISRRRLPKDWKWVEDDGMEVDVENDLEDDDGDEEEMATIPKKRTKRRGEGHWEDGNGNDIADVGAIKFQVVDVTPPFARDDKDRQIMSITGTMLSTEEEQELTDLGGSRAPSIAARRSRSAAPMPRGILKHSQSES